jgi:hypothetical protein
MNNFSVIGTNKFTKLKKKKENPIIRIIFIKKVHRSQKVGYNTKGVEEKKNDDGGEIEDSFLER